MKCEVLHIEGKQCMFKKHNNLFVLLREVLVYHVFNVKFGVFIVELYFLSVKCLLFSF